MKYRLKLFLTLIVLSVFFLHQPTNICAQTEESFEAVVTQVLNEKKVKPANQDEWQTEQELALQIMTGAHRHEKIILVNGNLPLVNNRVYQVGDRLVVSGNDGNYYISDIVRRPMLGLLAVIFMVAAIIVGRQQGLMSLVGLAASFAVIFLLVLPKIAAGENPIVVVILASLIIIPVIFLLSHGWNRKTIIAMIATFLTMIITGMLIVLFVDLTNLTGLVSEEAGFLQAMNPDLINLKNLLIAGMLIATLGVLDDVTISQAAIVTELHQVNEKLNFRQLYTQAMKIGRDHIASMINTLILVYAGASFPLLLLFQASQQTIGLTLNYEIIADEVVRTLTGSIGLILAVPLTTVLTALLVSRPIKMKLTS